MNSLVMAANKSVAHQRQSALDTFERHCRTLTPGSADTQCNAAQEQKLD